MDPGLVMESNPPDSRTAHDISPSHGLLVGPALVMELSPPPTHPPPPPGAKIALFCGMRNAWRLILKVALKAL